MRVVDCVAEAVMKPARGRGASESSVLSASMLYRLRFEQLGPKYSSRQRDRWSSIHLEAHFMSVRDDQWHIAPENWRAKCDVCVAIAINPPLAELE